MAEDTKLRSLRSNAPEAPSGDPLAELARLIGQDNLFDQMRRDATPGGRRAPAEPAAASSGRLAITQRSELHGGYDAFAGFPAEETYVPIDPAPVRAVRVTPDRAGDGHHGHVAQYPDPHAPAHHLDDGRGAYPDAYYDDAVATGHEAEGYGADEYGEESEAAPPKRRRVGLAAVAAVVGVAAIGTAGAFGYRALTGGASDGGPVPIIKADNTPAKVAPPTQGGDKDAGKTLYDRPDKGQSEKVVPREEQPVDMREARAAAPKMVVPPAGAGVPAAGSGPLTTGSTPAVNSNEPKKVRTFAIRPDGTVSTDSASSKPPAAPGSRVANLGSPTSPRPVTTRSITAPSSPETGAARPPADLPSRTAALPTTAPNSPSVNTPAPAAGGHVVQLSSQKSEADAQASFRALQAKYPTVLSGRQPMIRRVDLGPRGTFYRAQVGPFASAEQANEVCSSLKAAGGQCVVQRN